MAISEMRRVTVLGHSSRLAQVVEAIHKLGLLHITHYGEDLPEDERSQYQPSEQAQRDIEVLDSAIADLTYSIDFMAAKRHVNRSMLENFTGSRLFLTESEWQSATLEPLDRARSIHEQVRRIEQELADIADKRNRLTTSIEELRPWSSLQLPIEKVKSGKYVVTMLVTADVRTYASALSVAAEDMPGLAWEVVSVGRERAHIFVAYPATAGEQGLAALSAAGLSRVSLDQYVGVPSELIAGFEAQIADLDQRARDVEAEIDALVELRSKAYVLYDYLVNERAKKAVVSRFGATKRTFVVEGWIQAADMKRFRSRVEALAGDLVVLDRPPLDSEVPPVELTNGPLAAPFEVVTKTMGLPQPGTLDPSPYLAPFFLVFFGLAMTDAVYGIFIAAVALWLKRKTRQPNSKFLNLVFMAGLSTIVMGALLGGWLGDLPMRLFGMRTAILFDPMENPTNFLIFAFALGLVHILFGICLKAYQNIRTGNVAAAITDQGFWLALIVGLLLMGGGGMLGPSGPAIANVAKYVSIASALGLVATQGRHHRNILMRVGSGVLSLYGLTGYMSDVISYARLFGLGFTSTVLAAVLNDLMLRPAGTPIIGPVIAIVGLAFAHLFNIVINIIGAYVHSSRLQYIEFFGKFFESGGRRFVPFGFLAKYVDIDSLKGV